MLEVLSLLMENHWVQMVSVSIGIQWAAWSVAVFFKTEKFYDLVGSLTFMTVSHLSHARSLKTPRQDITSYLVFAWACRLGTFLAIRVLKDGGDKRFDQAKNDPATFFKFWTIQGLWVFITLIPTIALNNTRRNPPLGLRDYIGWGIWAAGFLIEVVADMQKSIFRSNPLNKGRFIQSGLWAYSRHPNYFGEISLWFGLYISCSSAFQGAEYATVISPIFVMLLITKLSGIPLLEAAGSKRWGGEAEYQKYIREVPVLIPFIKT